MEESLLEDIEGQEREEREGEDGEMGEEDEDGSSQASDESEDVVDAAVQEDIEKFQNSFEGITERFRLINRIGEGELLQLNLQRSVVDSK